MLFSLNLPSAVRGVMTAGIIPLGWNCDRLFSVFTPLLLSIVYPDSDPGPFIPLHPNRRCPVMISDIAASFINTTEFSELVPLLRTAAW
jgi:hypothetical protein